MYTYKLAQVNISFMVIVLKKGPIMRSNMMRSVEALANVIMSESIGNK